MQEENQNPNEPVRKSSPWVGVVLSFFISGASHYLSGKRFEGIVWFFSLTLLFAGACWCLASPTVPGDLPACVLFFSYYVLKIIMLIQSYRPIPKFRAFGWIGFVVFSICISEVVFHGIRGFVRPFKIPTAAMSPTLQGNRKAPNGSKVGGDRIFIECYAYWFSKPQRGDVVVFATEAIAEDQRLNYSIPPNEFYVKRVAGIPGDDLSIQDRHLYNHGKIVPEPRGLAKLEFLNGSYPSSYLSNPSNDYIVPKNSYFLVGDNTTNSLDSRYYGAVLRKGILGKVSKIWWPLQRMGNIQ
jgi:signal peptidase I